MSADQRAIRRRLVAKGFHIATELFWLRQTTARSEQIASIGLLVICCGCLVMAYGWPAMENATVIRWIGVGFLGLCVLGFIVRHRTAIEIDGHNRTITWRSSNRFGNKRKTYRFENLKRVVLQIFKVPEETTTAHLYLLFCDGNRVPVPEISMQNARIVAQEIVELTGTEFSDEMINTKGTLSSRK